MSKAVILCYHKVGPFAEEGRRLNIEPARLRAHVAYFARRKVPFLLAKDLSGPWPEFSVSFTFDDAYSSTMTHAPGVLEEFGKRGSFYAVSGKIGTTSDWDGGLARPLADWDALQNAYRAGHEIGNHSVSHPHLADLSLSEQSREVTEADREFAARGFAIESFCYPYGSVGSTEAIAPYSVGLALGKRPAVSTDDRLRLPRVVVAFSDALPMLLYKIYLKPLLKRARA